MNDSGQPRPILGADVAHSAEAGGGVRAAQHPGDGGRLGNGMVQKLRRRMPFTLSLPRLAPLCDLPQMRAGEACKFDEWSLSRRRRAPVLSRP